MVYILVPLVVIIWGLVLYRILDLGKDEAQINEAPIAVKTETKATKKDSFTIVANYRDPFLGKMTHQRRTTGNEVKKQVKKVKKPPPPPVAVHWPSIIFGGLIRNNQSNQEIAIVTINNQEALLGIEDKLQGVTLKKIFNKDSILVAMNDHKKVIKKQ